MYASVSDGGDPSRGTSLAVSGLSSTAKAAADDFNIILGRKTANARVRSGGGSVPMHRDYHAPALPPGAMWITVCVLLGDSDASTGCLHVYPGTRDVANDLWPGANRTSWQARHDLQAPPWVSNRQLVPAQLMLDKHHIRPVAFTGARGDAILFDAANLHSVTPATVADNYRRIFLFDIYTADSIDPLPTNWTQCQAQKVAVSTSDDTS